MQKLRLGVLGSGKGSNFAAIVEAIKKGKLSAEIAIVFSDNKEAGILAIAHAAGIRTEIIHELKYKTRLSLEKEYDIVKTLKETSVDLVILAGYMRIVKFPLLEAFPNRVINIHPSLLPKFRGLEAWRQALEAGETRTGCTIHFVDSGMDTGEIIAQAEVPIFSDDTPESLHARIQQQEHYLYPHVIASFCLGGSRALKSRRR